MRRAWWGGVGGGGSGAVAVAVADAVIVSFTLQTRKEVDALLNSNIHLQPPGPGPALSCPCPQLVLVLCPWVSCLVSSCLCLCLVRELRVRDCESVSERSDPPCLISLVHMPASCGLLACACSLITTAYYYYWPPRVCLHLPLATLARERERAPSSPHPNLHSCDPASSDSHLTSPTCLCLCLFPSSTILTASPTQISPSCAPHSISRHSYICIYPPFSAAHPLLNAIL